MNNIVEQFQNFGMNIRMALEYKLSTFDEIIQAAKNLPTLTEGYVCFDPVSGKRVKLKNPAYVAVHHLRENGAPSLKRIYELVLMNEHDEYLSYFEQDRKLFQPVIDDVQKFREYLEAEWVSVAHIEDQKTFALAVKDKHGSGFFFEAKKKKISALHAFDEATVDKKIKMFNIKNGLEIVE